jgi:hypothetical protein
MINMTFFSNGKIHRKNPGKNVHVPGIFASNFDNVHGSLGAADKGLQFLPTLAEALLVTTNYLR